MEIVEILREASNQIYQNVKDLAGTEDAAGDFGRGAGGDIGPNSTLIFEVELISYPLLMLYLQQCKWFCVRLL